MKTTSRLRQLMVAPGAVPLVGSYDAFSAKLAEQAGLPAVYLSGYCVSAAMLGLPDVGYLTLPEIIEVARRVTQRVDVPVICDGDDGYGNHLNVGRLIGEMEAAGVAGMQLEDQVSPKRCGHMNGKRLVTPAQMVAKIQAAVDARKDADFVIIARTDAIAVEGFPAAMDRAHQYARAGADVIFLEAPESIEQCRQIPAAFALPTVFNWAWGGKSPIPTADDLRAMGYKFLLCPDTIFAVARTLMNVYRDAAAHGTYAASTHAMVSFHEFNRMVGLDAVAALDARYGV